MKQYSHRRDLLTVHQLHAFRDFCATNGWQQFPNKGEHEVLRMRKDSEWLIVHKRDFTLAGSSAVVHCTVWGTSEQWAKRFFRERNGKATESRTK